MIGCDKCEEWYHGDCIDITEEESRFIKKFFCPRCREKDPSLTIKYKQKKLDQAGKDVSRKIKKEKKKQEQKSKEKEVPAPQYPQCGECINCYRAEDCGKCDACRGKKGKQCKYRVCLNYAPKKVEIMEEEEEPKPVLKEANYSDDDVWEPSLRKEKPVAPVKTSRGHSSNKKEKVKGKHRSRGVDRSEGHKRRKRITSSTDSAGEGSGNEKVSATSAKQKVIHCYGPQCIRASRPGSKYCSDQCGLNLATARIYQVNSLKCLRLTDLINDIFMN